MINPNAIFFTRHVFNVSDFHIEFLCDTMDTRNGFKHIVDLRVYLNGDLLHVFEAKYYYINRTWENYQYRTAMRKAAFMWKDGREEILKQEFKAQNGYKVINKARQEQLEAFYNEDAEIKAAKQLLTKL